MASIQRIGFTNSQNDLSKIFKALGHPARMAIIHHLIKEGRIMCKRIVLELPISQPAVSKHMQILLEVGLVGYEKVANATYYVVNPILIDVAKESLISASDDAKKVELDFSAMIFSTQFLRGFSEENYRTTVN